MRTTLAALSLLLLVFYVGKGTAGDAQNQQAKSRAALTVWDSGSPSAESLAAGALTARNGWTPIAAPQTAESFKGDAVLSNGRITAVLRRQGSALEVYSEGTESPIQRLRLLPLTASSQPIAHLDSVKLVENSRSVACLEVAGKTEQGEPVAAKFRLKRGDVFVQIEPGAGAGRLRIECPGRFTVLPDFAADDILIDAAKMPGPAIEVPTDNFVLHLTGTGDALGLAVFENRQQDVKLTLTGEDKQRTITGSEIGFEGKNVWVALLASPGVWYHRYIDAEKAGQIIPLEWHMPFPAQWRVDFTRADGLTDSWEMLLQEKKNAKYVKPSWLGGRQETLNLNRWRWNTYLDTFSYPCWTDHEKQGYLQPLEKKAFRFDGPAVLYPINRIKDTPLDIYTVVDIMRNTLGAGPCEHILDVEGQRTDYKGRPTCGVQGLLEEIYSHHQQRQRRAEVEKHLDDGLAFVTHIRSRIERYVDFARKMREYLDTQKKAHPELSDCVAEMDKLLERIDTRIAPELAKIQKPDFVVRLNEDFRKNVMDYDGPDALDRCKKYGVVLTDIGGNQDELVGECRWVVRTLRQRAALKVAVDPRVAPIANEVRARTQEVLRNPAGYEWSRH
jgi:hypothetical protein